MIITVSQTAYAMYEMAARPDAASSPFRRSAVTPSAELVVLMAMARQALFFSLPKAFRTISYTVNLM